MGQGGEGGNGSFFFHSSNYIEMLDPGRSGEPMAIEGGLYQRLYLLQQLEEGEEAAAAGSDAPAE